MPLPLAQSSGPGDIFFLVLILIVCVLVLFVAVVFLKRWLKSDDASTPGPGFTLSDLRQLVAEGKMTQEEFEKAKVAVVGSAKTAGVAKPSGTAMPVSSKTAPNPLLRRPK